MLEICERPRAAWSRACALALAVAGLCCGLGLPARAAADAIVIGDSLGVGVSMASGLTRLARNSVAIRGGSILGQLREAKPGSVVFMSLGTNDAVGRVDGLDGDIARIVAAAGSVKLVWIGPPCVSKSWDSNALKLDGILKARTAGTGVVYVSMRDPAMCESGVRAKDGVHFTMGGYGMMWSKARLAAGFTGGSDRTMIASVSRKKSKRRYARRKTGPAVAAAAAAKAAGESVAAAKVAGEKPVAAKADGTPVAAKAEAPKRRAVRADPARTGALAPSASAEP